MTAFLAETHKPTFKLTSSKDGYNLQYHQFQPATTTNTFNIIAKQTSNTISSPDSNETKSATSIKVVHFGVV